MKRHIEICHWSRFVSRTGNKGLFCARSEQPSENRPLVPVGGTNRDQRPIFGPGWWHQPGPKAYFGCPIHYARKLTLWSRFVERTGTKGKFVCAFPNNFVSRLISNQKMTYDISKCSEKKSLCNKSIIYSL